MEQAGKRAAGRRRGAGSSGAGRRLTRLRSRTWERLGGTGRWLAVTGTGAALALGGGVAWGAWTHICADCPSIAQIYAFEPKVATRVYAADGSLLHELAIERRTTVPFDALPPYVADAFVAIEDRRFWTHRGVDWLRTVRAAVDFMLHGYDVPGGSTITQQLAGNMFTASVNRQERSVRRKLREIRVALDLEHAYTKEEILEAYLNQINFDGVYGIQSAARRYFGKDARELNLPEAAALAALPRAPARYSPLRNPERSVARRNLVLRLMAEQGRISRQDAAAAMAYPLELAAGAGEEVEAPYFVEWVRRQLVERYGTQVYEAGLRVYTTLDPALQAVADSALRAQLEWIERQPGFAAPTYTETRDWPEDSLAGPEMPYLQGTFIALDPRDGSVLAMIGGRDFDDSEFNRATQARRQPGSAFKPFVYTAALAAGIPASEVIFDTPVEFPQPDGTIWSPSNFEGTFSGPITLRDAFTRSVNVVAVKLGQRVGIETVAQYAHRLGIRTEVPLVPSTAIGAPDVIPIEMAEAYGALTNLGVRVTPRAILRVESADGRLLWESRAEREEVLDEGLAWVMLSLMQDVVNRGTAARVRALGVPASVPVAGKTGTTNEATDAWFLGATPDLVTATWVGFDRPAKIRTGAQGGRDAAPVNAAVLRWVYERRPHPEPWPRPAEITEREVDARSGGLATAWCPAESVYREVYLPGTEPAEACELHSPWGGRLLPDSLPADTARVPLSEEFDF